jgi:hypothetical protein
MDAFLDAFDCDCVSMRGGVHAADVLQQSDAGNVRDNEFCSRVKGSSSPRTNCCGEYMGRCGEGDGEKLETIYKILEKEGDSAVTP